MSEQDDTTVVDDDGAGRAHRRVVVFRAGDERFAVDASSVDAVVDGVDARPLPGFSERVAGVLRYRGEWTLALDVGPALGIEGAARGSAAVVVRHEGLRYALVADDLPAASWLDTAPTRRAGVFGSTTASAASGSAPETVADGHAVFVDADGPVTYVDPGELFSIAVPDGWEETMRTSEASVAPRPVVAFRVGDQDFGLDVFEVHEVLPYEPPRSMPRAPDFVEGVLDVRDAVIPVVDMRSRFELEPRPPDEDTRILVVALGSERIGLIVDAVSEVVHLPTDSVSPPPEYFRGLAEEYLAGIARLDEGVLILLRMDRVLTTEQRLALLGDDVRVDADDADDATAGAPGGGAGGGGAADAGGTADDDADPAGSGRQSGKAKKTKAKSKRSAKATRATKSAKEAETATKSKKKAGKRGKTSGESGTKPASKKGSKKGSKRGSKKGPNKGSRKGSKKGSKKGGTKGGKGSKS